MHVPLLDLQAQFAPIRDEVLAALTRVCDSQQFIMGPEVEAFERELASSPTPARHRRLVRAPTPCSSP
jgi:dTDP-4-amino-4,6-dideoxygalactose transaminase